MYLTNDELLFELIICKGKGKISKKLIGYFVMISENIVNKLHEQEYYDDQIGESILYLMERWNYANIEKYPDNVFSYYSEISKRSMTQIWNKYNHKSNNKKYPGIYVVSLNKFVNY